MKRHRYTAVPMITDTGKYIGTITEGDLLWKFLEDEDMTLEAMERFLVRDVPRRTVNRPVSVNANIADLIEKAMQQNFVPVIDDDKVFIGIVTRKEILQYCEKKLFQKGK